MLVSQKALSIQRLIADSVKNHDEKFAILSPNRPPLTYQRLYAQLEAAIHTLNSMGLGRGDRVAIVLPNGPEMAVAFLAVTVCATSAPLNPAYREADFDFYLSDLNAKAVIVQADVDSPVRAVALARNIPMIELTPRRDAEAGIFHLTGATGFPPTRYVEADGEDVALVLHTSGTTSRPKIVPLTQANLCASAWNIGQSLQLTQGDRCLNVMPLFHIHGLIAAVLASLASGGSVVCTPSFHPDRFFDWMQEFQPTWYTAVPTIHQAVLANFATNRSKAKQCSLRFIRSSSAALPPQLMEALEHAFHVPVMEAYGMTEASHQIASNPLPPGNRKPRSVGMAAGPDVAIMDENGNLLEPGELGEIVIRGANVTQGYENNPRANAQAFTHGWFRTGDQGYLDPDGYLYITGRLKELINRGGEKISPREIDEVLLDHPAIAQAVTFAVPHPTLGEQVAVAAVLQPEAQVDEQAIRKFAADRLPAFKVPSQIIVVEDIPKGATGKLQRIGLAEKLASHLKPAFIAPETETEIQLATIWSEVLGIDSIGIQDNFFALGGDSLKAMQVLAKLQTTFQVDLPLSSLYQTSTIQQLAEALTAPSQQSYPWYSLVSIQPAGSRSPLFAIHNLYYKDLADCLGADQPIYALRYGFAAMTTTSTFTLPNRIEDLAAHYIKEMQVLQPEGPYFLMGNSFGGTIAFEMAQQLVAQGHEVPLLVLFDSDAPGSRKREALPLTQQFANLVQVGIAGAIERVTAKIKKRFERLTRLDQKREASLHQQYAYTPAVYCPIGEKHFFEPYEPKPYPGRVLFFEAQGKDGRAQVEPLSVGYSYETLEMRWRRLCSGQLDYFRIPGGHASMLEAPHVSLLAEKVKFFVEQIN